MDRARRGEGVWARLTPFALDANPLAEALHARIAAEGPLAASDLDGPKGPSGWWGWSEGKSALEWLFWTGRIAARTRRSNFERVYDLRERVLPKAVLETPTPEPAAAHRSLMAMAGKALGVATALELRDYFRLSPEDATPALAALLEEGVLTRVDVEGQAKAAYLHRDAAAPKRVHARALLAPFDPLIWERSRTERLFGLRYRLEIYTPKHKRAHGYYVLPYLFEESLAARLDLKADRKAARLRVMGAHAEAGAPKDVVEPLRADLLQMAAWLGLEGCLVEPQGDLASRLATKAGRIDA
jgi:uncharacterized protein YcaQ